MLCLCELRSLRKSASINENVSNVRISTAEIAFFFYKSNVKFAKAVRELFSVVNVVSGLTGTFVSLTCLVAADRQLWKGDTLISSRSWNKTMT